MNIIIDGGTAKWRAERSEELLTVLQRRNIAARFFPRDNPGDDMPSRYKRGAPGAWWMQAFSEALYQPNAVMVIRGGWWTHARNKFLRLEHARMLERLAFSSMTVVLRPRNHADTLEEERCSLQPYTVRSDALPALDELLHTATPSNHGPGGGCWQVGNFLLIGDRPNTAALTSLKYRVPFLSFHGGGCSSWLAHGLETLARVPESRLYWINAYTAQGDATPADFVAQLQPRMVLALGEQAALWARSAGLAHATHPHPSHWRRFHHGAPYSLYGALRAGLAGCA